MRKTEIKFGYREVDFPGSDLGQLRESQDLLDNSKSLRQRLRDDGFLLLRGLIDRSLVSHARRTVLAHLQEKHALVPNTPMLEGVMPNGGRSVQMMGRKGIAHHHSVLSVLENEALFKLFDSLFDEPALSFPYKWLRAVGNEQYTGAHFDYVYMGRGSARLHTVWIPFGDIPVEQGALAICVGSHKLDSFARIRQTYGRMDVDRDGIEGWFSRDPMEIVERYGGQWQTTAYRAGDVVIFGMHTMHASTTNLTNRFRLSCDVRFQPAADPVDERWKTAGSGHNAVVQRDMESARAEWGV